MGNRLEGLERDLKKVRREGKLLRETLERQTEKGREIAGQLKSIPTQDEELRKTFLSVQERLLQRDEEIQAALYDLAVQTVPAGEHSPVLQDLERRQMIRGVREFIRGAVPADANILVASNGDAEFVNLYGRLASHFPPASESSAPGERPPNAATAIIQVEALRGEGAEFFLFPEANHALLDEFSAFRSHLENRYREIPFPDGTARLFDLRKPSSQTASAWRRTFEAAAAECEVVLKQSPSILDLNTGLQMVQAFPQLTIFSPSTTERTVPYLDRSVDLVAYVAGDRIAVREARRVASVATLRVTLPKADSIQGATIAVEWVSNAKRAVAPSVSIIIPVYNAIKHTRNCLKTLNEVLPIDFRGEIIVIDDASTDQTPAVLARLKAEDRRLKVIRNKQNAGFVVNCNRAARAAKGDYLLFLNNDTLPQPGCIEHLLATFRLYPDAGAVGGKLIYPNGRLQEAGSIVFADGSGANFGRMDRDSDAPLYNYVREVDYCSGALLATPRSLFLKLGGFDTRYRPAYYEDNDYCFQVREKGFRVYYQPASQVIHLEGISSGTDTSSGTKKFQVINHAKFMKKWSAALKRQPPPMDLSQLDSWEPLAHYPRYNGKIPSVPIKRALLCAPVMPEFDRESGSRRIYDILMFLREAGWSVSFVAQRAPSGERYAHLLQQHGIATHIGFTLLTDRLIAAGRFDLAVFEFWDIAEQHLPFLRRVSPNTRVIVDSIDLHFIRNSRQVFTGTQRRDHIARLDSHYATEMVRELNIYGAADSVMAVSQKEATLINDFTGDGTLAHVMPDSESMELAKGSFAQRKGILFLGSFRHTPNVDAAEYLCKSILPKIDPALLAKHPVYVVGTGLNDTIRAFAKGLRNVHMIGWVPSVLPYLVKARISVIPLLYGAGTKRKLVQALMAGTPTVSTSIGTEGLGLTSGKQVLVADNAELFARSVERLLKDEKLWKQLRQKGHDHITPLHGHDTARRRLLAVTTSVFKKKAKPAKLSEPNKDQNYRLSLHYQQLLNRIRETVQRNVPSEATILVVGKGDESLLKLEPRQAWPFPQNEEGVYSGHHPPNSGEAIAHLEELRAKGAQYMLFPHTSLWWLEHYSELRQHLDATYRLLLRREDTCVIYSLEPRVTGRSHTTNGKSSSVNFKRD